MIRKFLIQCFLLSLPIAIGVGIYFYVNLEFLPAPRYTNNIALNTKLEIGLRDHGQLDILSIGSSMNHNNLSTKAVSEKWSESDHFNFGHWGCNMESLLQLLPFLIEKKQPEKVILTTNLMDMLDFQSSMVDTSDLRRSFSREPIWMNYFCHWNMPYYLRQMESNKVRLTDPANYEYLNLDEDGGAALNVPKDRISADRYNRLPPASSELSRKQYEALREIGEMLKKDNIELIVLISPYREGVLDETSRKIVRGHVMRLSQTLGAMGHKVLDGTDRNWQDDLYCDSSHFNEPGAYQFTAYCLAKLP
jgi:hypothetical protein